LLEVYSDAAPNEVLKTPPDFIRELGLESKLSPSRANGLFAMFKQIQLYATAFHLASMRP
jgi:cysteine desulfuration protein SufE